VGSVEVLYKGSGEVYKNDTHKHPRPDHYVFQTRPLMYPTTFIQATMVCFHIDTLSALVVDHDHWQGTSSNQPWWI
jgi:hypothetical protein